MRSLTRQVSIASFVAAAVLIACGLAVPAYAQLGTGWIQTNHSKRIHLDDHEGLQTFSWTANKSVCSPTSCADYSYDASTDTETFRIFDSRSNRSEIRLQNDYSTGIRQFEGYVTFFEPLHDESLFQIFGNSGSAATYAMMRGYRDNGGEIRVLSPARTIASGVYGDEVRINMIHLQNQWSQWYVNGQLVLTKSESDTEATNYWKYGVYGTTSGNVPAVSQWRAVRTFRDGLPPDVNNTPPGAYEAENATLSGAVFANNQTGYTGTGFVDYINTSRDYVEWTFDTQATGMYDIKFRYALESGDRPLHILLNGELLVPTLGFAATGAWENWAYVTIPSQLLEAGTNTVRATAGGESGANLDHLLVAPAAGFMPGDYDLNGIVDSADYVLWRDRLGRPVSLPNDDSPGVGEDDFDRWRTNFGNSLAADVASVPLTHIAVPEPATLGMMLLAVIAALALRPSHPWLESHR